MVTHWKGVYDHGKWWTSAAIQFLSDGGFTTPIPYHRACLDTGSPYIVFPAKCPSPPSGENSLSDIVRVELPVDSSEHPLSLSLPPRGRVFRFGGVGGATRDRYLFCADLAVDGLEYDDLVNVVFLDPDELPHPIIGLAEIVESARTVTFSRQGFRMA